MTGNACDFGGRDGISLRVLTAGRSRQPRRALTVCAALTLTSWAVALYALLKTFA